MEYKPQVLKDHEIESCIAGSNAELLDLIPSQVRELFIIDHLARITDKSRIEEDPAFKSYSLNKEKYSRYFFYPWLNKIIKTVSKEDFYSLKTNRNRDLITEAEQHTLRDFTVAVIGLSVGSNIAFLLTQAGISNQIYVADPDSLDTSNLNRLLTGVQDCGINKAILSARKIVEGNPYAEPVPLENGINEESLEELLQEGTVRCIVEEVDSLPVKISTRKLAMKYKVPVLMVTDNGFSIALHVERYDLGYNEIFEKEVVYWDEALKGTLDHQKISQLIIENIFGSVAFIDPRLFASNRRIMMKELVSWPQLGSTAMMGGTAAVQMIRKIALGESTELFIRKFISLGI